MVDLLYQQYFFYSFCGFNGVLYIEVLRHKYSHLVNVALMWKDKAKHPLKQRLSCGGTCTHTHTHTHSGVTGHHIFRISLQAGIPGQQRRDNVSALLVKSLFYPVSGPQSVKGVCLWHTRKHMPHMHNRRTRTDRFLQASKTAKAKKIQVTKALPTVMAAGIDKSYALVLAMHFEF